MIFFYVSDPNLHFLIVNANPFAGVANIVVQVSNFPAKNMKPFSPNDIQDDRIIITFD
jgi:hypothetical protein